MIIKLSPILPDPLPLGYRLNMTRRGTVLESDLDLLSRIYDAFALVADARRSLTQITETLSEDGLVTPEGTPYPTSALRAILHEPFYAGYVRQAGVLVRVECEPLIPRDVWHFVQRQLGPDSAPHSLYR